jgi:hypothetical protein
MSTIGSASGAGFTLASSVVGSSRPDAVSDRNRVAAEQNAEVDRQSTLSETLDDVADAEFGTDRDADGRQAYRRSGNSPEPTTSELQGPSVAGSPQHASDAFGERGNSLDLEA